MEPIDILIRPRIEYVVIQGCTQAGMLFVIGLQGIPEMAHEGIKQVFGDNVIQEVFDLIDKAGLASLMT